MEGCYLTHRTKGEARPSCPGLKLHRPQWDTLDFYRRRQCGSAQMGTDYAFIYKEKYFQWNNLFIDF